MQGVSAGNRHNLEQAALCRTEKGRLVVVGDVVDLFELLRWVDENPLTQFRETTPRPYDEKFDGTKYFGLRNPLAPVPAEEPFEPSDQFKHLFSPEGQVL